MTFFKPFPFFLYRFFSFFISCYFWLHFFFFFAATTVLRTLQVIDSMYIFSVKLADFAEPQVPSWRLLLRVKFSFCQWNWTSRLCCSCYYYYCCYYHHRKKLYPTLLNHNIAFWFKGVWLTWFIFLWLVV